MTKPYSLEDEIAKLRQDKRNVALPYLIFIYALLLLLLYCAAMLHKWNYFWIIPMMGIVQYYVVISGHEAVHKTLCYPLKLNDFFGVLGQSMVGVNFTAYRLQHLDHHRCRDHVSDPDSHIYYSIITTPRGWKRTLKLTLGTLIEIVVKIHQKGSGGYGTKQKIKPDIQYRMKRDSRLVIFAQFCLLLSCGSILSGVVFPVDLSLWGLVSWGFMVVAGYALLWIFPLFCITVFLNRCRILIEHGLAWKIAQNMEMEFGGPRIPTIDIVPHPIERRMFAPFLFNYHCSHHLFMTVPHYNLPRLYKLLKEREFAGHHEVPGGYLSSLRKTMNL